jgi:hypothetical protein
MPLTVLVGIRAGLAFIVGGLHGKTHIKDLGGYAIVYFLVAGFLLHRKLSKLSSLVLPLSVDCRDVKGEFPIRLSSPQSSNPRSIPANPRDLLVLLDRL